MKQKIAFVGRVPQTTQNLVISRFFTEDGKEMYKIYNVRT